MDKSLGTTPSKDAKINTPKKTSMFETTIKDSILMLDSICLPKRKEDEEFQLLKTGVNTQMKKLKQNSLELLSDLFNQ